MRQRNLRPKRFVTELLERRVLFSAAAATSVGGAHPTYELASGSGAQPLATGSATLITPAQMVQAYGVNGISFGGVTGDGTGQTIAIVDAYDDPNALSDLQTFDSTYGLANPPSFKKLNENGGTSLPPTDTTDPKGDTWELEESLDIEWAHVIAPKANIILYEASSTSYSDLLTHAVTTAAANAAVSVVSMSFGGGLATSLDSTFTTPSSHVGGVTFVASTGDSGSPGGYPAYSPNVVAVGGTTLILDPTTHAWQSETGWSGSGGGLGTGSGDEPRPAYQNSVSNNVNRSIPDVAMDADPNSGVPVYDTFDGGWFQVGGTSLSSPMFAGLIAIANQGRAHYGLPTLDGPTQTLPYIYQLPQSDFHDILSGSNGGFTAGTNYDPVTGRGSPIANLFVTSLAQPVATPSHVVIVMEEDRFANAIGDTTNMPYTNQLASTGLVYSNAHGLDTPAQEGQMDYLALYSGSTQGVTSNSYSGPFSGTNLAQSLNNTTGRSFAGYSESLPSNGDTTDAFAAEPGNPAYDDLYVRAYNPMAQFTNVGTGKTNAQVNLTFGNFPTTSAGYAALPTVSIVVPNTLDNSHGSNDTNPFATDPSQYNFLRQNADTWLQNNINGYLQWAKANNSLLIILGDEGDRQHGFTSLATNDPTMIINGASGLFVPGTDTSNVNPYSVLRTIEDMYGLKPLNNTTTAAHLDVNASGQLVPNESYSTTTLTTTASPTVYGQSITYTATVAGPGSPTGGIPTGSVTFKDGSTVLGSGTVNSSGVATFTTNSLGVGSHLVTAYYGSDSIFAASNSFVASQTVNKASDTTALASSANPAVFGQSVTFTATVTATAPSTGIAGGTITFMDGTTTLGTGALNASGVATFTTSSLSVGSHSITAAYGGSSNFNTSTSSATTQTVNKASTTSTVTSITGSSVFGQAVTFGVTVAAVAPGAGTRTGTVQFAVDGVNVGSPVAISAAGTASSAAVSNLSVGNHTITAVYSGDTHFSTSTSAGFTQTVSKASTTTAVASSANPAAPGQSITFTATVTVTSPGAGTPTGNVTFMDGSTTLGTGAVNASGQATFTTTTLAAGPHSITAVYAGDSNFTTSTSATLSQTISGGSAIATYVQTDTTTSGTWTGTYGSDGYSLFNAGSSLPAYAQLSVSNAQSWTWDGAATDPRALQNSPSSTSRTAACNYSNTSFTYDLNLTDGNTHRVALYVVDWDSKARSETIQITDASSNAVLSTQSVSNFVNGDYLVWDLSGHVHITVTWTGGDNAVVSGMFFSTSAGANSASATFVKSDTVTSGTWTGSYGADGYSLLNGPSQMPTYAQVTGSNFQVWTWDGSPTDTRALQTSPSSTSRLAACDYSTTSFSLDVNLTDGQTHQIALYMVDYDNTNRAQTVQIADAGTNGVLDTETVSNFHGGVYLVWNVKGHVKITITKLAGDNAVASGLFFGA
jgi:hypothetical protein